MPSLRVAYLTDLKEQQLGPDGKPQRWREMERHLNLRIRYIAPQVPARSWFLSWQALAEPSLVSTAEKTHVSMRCRRWERRWWLVLPEVVSSCGSADWDDGCLVLQKPVTASVKFVLIRLCVARYQTLTGRKGCGRWIDRNIAYFVSS